MTLAHALRTGTHSLHRSVEASGLMSALLRGQIDRAGYVIMQRNLHAIYAALEAALEQHSNHPALSPLGCARYRRLDALASDLLALQGPAWALDLALMPTAAAYAEHLHGLAREQPARLAAHAYVRYLGDLSGGQMLRSIVAGALKLGDGVGTSFFDFGDSATVQALAASFRAGLDALPLVAISTTALVQEAQFAFTLHARLFDELDAARASVPVQDFHANAAVPDVAA